jgi:hypothetical protein
MGAILHEMNPHESAYYLGPCRPGHSGEEPFDTARFPSRSFGIMSSMSERDKLPAP